MAYKTKKIGNVNAVHIGDLGLKYGKISPNNSLPYVNVDYANKLIEMDKGIGEPYYITSAMGGQHASGPRSHGAGVKLDLVGSQSGGKFSPRAQDYINKNYIGNGAIGWHNAGSGYHNDITLLGGKGMQNSALNGAPVYLPPPQLRDVSGQVMGLGQTGAQYVQGYNENYNNLVKELDNRYNLAREQAQAEQNVQNTVNTYVPQANTQMGMNVIPTEEIQRRANQAAIDNTIAGIQSQDARNFAVNEYRNQPSAQDNINLLNEQYNQFMNNYVDSNPLLQQYYQAQQTGQLPQGAYQVDPERLAQLYAGDKARNDYLMTRAAQGDDYAKFYLANGGQSNEADKYLQNAQLLNQIALANQYGIPYEQLMANVKQMGEYQKAITPNMIAGINDTIAQQGQNFRKIADVVPTTASKDYTTNVQANQDLLSSLINANKGQIEINKPGADIIKQGAQDVTEMQAKRPSEVNKKYETTAGLYKAPVQPTIQTMGSLINTTSENLTGMNKNINTANTDIYGSTATQYNKARDIISKAEAEGQQSPENVLKTVKAKQDVYNNAMKLLVGKDPVSGLPTINAGDTNKILFAQSLLNSGLYTEDEVASLMNQLFPAQSEVTEQSNPQEEKGIKGSLNRAKEHQKQLDEQLKKNALNRASNINRSNIMITPDGRFYEGAPY